MLRKQTIIVDSLQMGILVYPKDPSSLVMYERQATSEKQLKERPGRHWIWFTEVPHCVIAKLTTKGKDLNLTF